MTTANIVIDVKNLSKHFAGKPAVNQVNLTIQQGEIFGFLGPNGSGKTTTIRMLCGLLTPDSGEGHCLGYDIITESEHIKRHVGYMTQKFSFYEDLSIEENLKFVAQVYELSNQRQRVKHAIEQLGLYQRRKQLAGELSGGWKQRLALAACLLHDPRLLLLDEPTAGVDPKARREFWDQIHELSQQGITTLVSTHYMDEAERCTRLAYISKGTILVDGSRKQIIQQVGLTTWVVSGEQLSTLAKSLHDLPGVEQVVIFGETLHVSGQQAELLKQSITPMVNQQTHTWQLSHTTLEDAFIKLVDYESK